MTPWPLRVRPGRTECRRCILTGMAIATFQISPQNDDSFNVEMTTAGDLLRTIPGFGSEHEAKAWIVQISACFNRPIHVTTHRPEMPSSAISAARKASNTRQVATNGV
jgi:hypothetical protein